MRHFTPEQVETISTHLIGIGDLFPEPEQQAEDLAEGYELLQTLDLDSIPYHHLDILMEVYGFEGTDEDLLKLLNNYEVCNRSEKD